MNILFICRSNKMRSRTAEDIYRDDPRFVVRSAGIKYTAPTPISDELIQWADFLVPMETKYQKIIQKMFPLCSKSKKFLVLDIPDIYQYMNEELVQLIKERFEKAIDENP